jgi:hypothetical protein
MSPRTAIAIHFHQGIPERAVRLDVSRVRRGQRFLAYGPVSESLVDKLAKHDAEVFKVVTADHVIEMLEAVSFDGLLVSPSATPQAFELVRRVKRHDRQNWADLPVFVLPLPDESEYAVIIEPPELAFLEDERSKPLALTILTLNVARLRQACSSPNLA